MAGRHRERDVRQFEGFVTRVVSAYGRRVGNGELEALPALMELRKKVDETINDTIETLRGEPYRKTTNEIAEVLGVTRQAVGQRLQAAAARKGK